MSRKNGFLPKNHKNIFIKNSNDESRINEMMYSLKLEQKELLMIKKSLKI